MPCVLVVDDDPDVLALVSDVLLLEGYDVRSATDGVQALHEIERERPDCVVLDVMMPGLDGFAVLERIRSAEDGALPVVMLTAGADDARAWKAWTEGVDYFLAKPFDASELLRYLAYLFDGEADLLAG